MRNGILFIWALAVGTACEEQGAKPPPPRCCGTPHAPTVGGPGLPPSEMDGGTADAGSSDPVRLEGEVSLVTDIVALTFTRFDETAALRAEGVNGDVLGQWDGIGPFALDGVKGGGAWAMAAPGPGDTLRGLRPVNTSAPDGFGVVTTRIMIARPSDFIAAFDLLSSPIEFIATAGHAILVATVNGAPVAGARVTAPRDATVLYVENGEFSDTATSTDESGTFMLTNVPAVEWRGSVVTLTLAGPAPGSYALLLVSGGVTISDVGN